MDVKHGTANHGAFSNGFSPEIAETGKPEDAATRRCRFVRAPYSILPGLLAGVGNAERR